MTDIQKLLEQVDKALQGTKTDAPYSMFEDYVAACKTLVPELRDALLEAQAEISSLHRRVSDTATAFAGREDALRTRLAAAEAVLECYEGRLNSNSTKEFDAHTRDIDAALETWRKLRDEGK